MKPLLNFNTLTGHIIRNALNYNKTAKKATLLCTGLQTHNPNEIMINKLNNNKSGAQHRISINVESQNCKQSAAKAVPLTILVTAELETCHEATEQEVANSY